MPEIVKTITREEYDSLKEKAFYNVEADDAFYKTTWIRRFWRPAMAWLYFTTIAIDFIILPIIHAQFGTGPYQSITLQGGGLFHVAMGAIVGISALGRTWEKIGNNRFGGGGYDNYGGGYSGGYNYNTYTPDSYHYNNIGQQPNMVPHDNLNDALSKNEDEIIPPAPGVK